MHRIRSRTRHTKAEARSESCEASIRGLFSLVKGVQIAQREDITNVHSKRRDL